LPGASIRSPGCSADSSEFGTDRLSPSSKATTSSERSTSGAEQARERRPVLEFGAGAVQIAVGDDPRPPLRRIGVRNLRHRQSHAAGEQVEFAEER